MGHIAGIAVSSGTSHSVHQGSTLERPWHAVRPLLISGPIVARTLADLGLEPQLHENCLEPAERHRTKQGN